MEERKKEAVNVIFNIDGTKESNNQTKSVSSSSICSCQFYPRSLLQHLNDQRSSASFCDVEIVADGLKLNAHKAVLSASSPYFRAMFSAGLKEQEQKSIELHLISASVLKALMDFIYSGNIEITSNNVQELLIAADMIQLAEVFDLCSRFLKREMHSSNAIGIYRFSENGQYRELQIAARNFIHAKFPNVSREDEFLTLPISTLESFLESEYLRVDSEFQVFQAAIRWITHDVIRRRCHVFNLFRHIRLPLLSTSHLDGAINGCADICLRTALRTIRSDLEKKKGILVPLSVRPRICAKKDIFVIGGSRREPVGSWTHSSDCVTYKSVLRFDTFKREWGYACPMRLKRVLPGVATLDSRIFVVGGEEDSQILANGECYDPLEDTWTTIASMTIPRCEFGLCALDGTLYAMGGWIGEDLGDSIERYDPVEDEWTLEGSLPGPLISMGVVSYEGLIYIVGGCTQLKRHLQEFRSFNPVTKEWMDLPKMTVSRSQMGVCILDGYLYVVGGTNRHNQLLQSVERYSFQENKWSHVSPMLFGRTCPAVSAADGYLYVMGGMQTQEVNFWRAQITISSVECYDPLMDTWRECPPLPESRGEAGAVVV